MKTGNTLLDALPPDVVRRIEPDIQEVRVARHQVVHHPGEEIRHLHFPLTCMISVTVTMSDGASVETDAVGCREVVGINAFMGGRVTTQTEYVGQVAGAALKIAAAPLREEFDRNSEMRSVLLKYTQVMIGQISQNVACNRLHAYEERSARWLLEIRDRVQSDQLQLTHEFMAQMLGVTRTTVSVAMSKIRAAGAIDYTRGSIEVLDPLLLEEMSCECYFVIADEYERLLGADVRRRATTKARGYITGEPKISPEAGRQTRS